MPPTIREIGPDLYHRYAEIDPSYEVASVLKVLPRDGGLGGLQFVEEKVAQPYPKGADTPNYSPLSWPSRQEAGAFAAFLAMDGDIAIGGAAVIINPAAAFLFERRETLSGLWDIRVRRDYRRTGVGSQLLLHAADWAKKWDARSSASSARTSTWPRAASTQSIVYSAASNDTDMPPVPMLHMRQCSFGIEICNGATTTSRGYGRRVLAWDSEILSAESRAAIRMSI